MQTSAGRMGIVTSLNKGGGDSPTPPTPPTPSILPDGAVEVEYIEFTDEHQDIELELIPYEAELAIVLNLPTTEFAAPLVYRGDTTAFYGINAGDLQIILWASECSFTPRTDLLFRTIGEAGGTYSNTNVHGFLDEIYLGVVPVSAANWVIIGGNHDTLVGMQVKRGYMSYSDFQYNLIPCRKGSDAYLYDTRGTFTKVRNRFNVPLILGPDV